MAKDTTLRLFCDASLGDYYEYVYEPEGGGDNPFVIKYMRGTHNGYEPITLHTVEQARELFSWLGAMLHK